MNIRAQILISDITDTLMVDGELPTDVTAVVCKILAEKCIMLQDEIIENRRIIDECERKSRRPQI